MSIILFIKLLKYIPCAVFFNVPIIYQMINVLIPFPKNLFLPYPYPKRTRSFTAFADASSPPGLLLVDEADAVLFALVKLLLSEDAIMMEMSRSESRAPAPVALMLASAAACFYSGSVYR